MRRAQPLKKGAYADDTTTLSDYDVLAMVSRENEPSGSAQCLARIKNLTISWWDTDRPALHGPPRPFLMIRPWRTAPNTADDWSHQNAKSTTLRAWPDGAKEKGNAGIVSRVVARSGMAAGRSYYVGLRG